MNRASKILLSVFLALWAGIAAAQLEVIELRSRSAAEVLPVLQPLVEPGGTLTGLNNQLFLRASPKNREEIRRALAAIDRPARRLIIHVASERLGEIEQREAELAARAVITSYSIHYTKLYESSATSRLISLSSANNNRASTN